MGSKSGMVRAKIQLRLMEKGVARDIGWIVLIGVLFISGSPMTAWGQLVSGAISGTVKDATGAVTPGAKITVRNVETGITRTVQSDASGRYLVTNLAPGHYEIQAELTGFQTEVRRGVSLTLGREAVVDLTLRIGQVQEQVVVTAEAPLVDTSSAALTGLVDQQQVTDLPLNGRSLTQLTTLQTGVLSYTSRSTSTGTGQNITINGARPRQINFLLNGTHIMNVFGKSPGGISGNQLGVEGVREFTVMANSYSAEFGRSAGGVINAVSKSGTNTFHGTLFEYLRNDKLDAREFFEPRVPPFKRNQFGGNLGGPIRRDKTFFFVNAEFLRERLGRTIIPNFPTAAARQGILPGRPVFTVVPAVKPYLDLMPIPTGQDLRDGTALDTVSFSEPTNQYYGNVRIDHQFSDSDSLFGSYVIDDSDQTTFGTIPLFFEQNPYRSQYVALEETHIFSPTLLNTAHLGFNRSKTNLLPSCDDSIAPLEFAPGKKCFRLSVTGVSVPSVSLGPRIWFFNSFQYGDTVSWTPGNHALKFGGYFERLRLNGMQESSGTGLYDFTSLENFLRATPRFYRAPKPGLNLWRGMRQNLFAFFANDSIRLRPNLTVNLGVRYEFINSPVEVDGLLSNLPCLLCPARVGEPLFDNPSLKSFSPRVGVAWSPGESQNTSLRAGFGIFYDQLLHHLWADIPFHSAPLWEEIQISTAGLPFPNAFDLFRANPNDPRFQTSFVFGIDADPPQPYMMQYNFSGQRQLPGQIVVQAAYVGSVGRHIQRNVDNQAFPTILPDGRIFFPADSVRRNPNFAEYRIRVFDTNTSYNSLQLALRRRFAQGVGFQVSYTWSKTLDMMSEAQGTGDAPNDTTFATLPDFPKLDKGRAAFDAAHNFTANFTVDLPFGRGLSGASAKLLGGWRTQGIWSLQTGLPIAVLIGFDNARFRSNRNQGRPNLNPGFDKENVILGTPNETGDISRPFLDPKAFSLPEAGFLGNLGRNIFSGPGLATVDFSLIKNTGITERVNLEFRSEFFNLFNRANFSHPSQTAFSARGPVGSFATIGDTRTTGRQIQFALKLTF